MENFMTRKLEKIIFEVYDEVNLVLKKMTKTMKSILLEELFTLAIKLKNVFLIIKKF